MPINGGTRGRLAAKAAVSSEIVTVSPLFMACSPGAAALFAAAILFGSARVLIVLALAALWRPAPPRKPR
jgi:hypothetical protein